MYIIIVGCGRVGSELAFRLFQKGHQIVIIDHIIASFQNLHHDFRGRTIEGEALNHDVLLRAGIKQAEGLAVVTNSDSLNAVVGHIAKVTFQVPNVIVRNYDPHLRPMYEIFGLQTVSSSSWGAQRIEELISQTNLRTVFSAGNGEVEIYEFMVPSFWDNFKLQEILPDSECVPVALTRAGHSLLPSVELVLEKGDILLFSATLNGIKALQQKINRSQEI
jgi:trk system potassium uptake protein TrkA